MFEENLGQRTDPSQNFIDRQPQLLDAIFYPKSVAVIGAKDSIGSVGCTIMSNLMAGTFGGRIYPVNPKRSSVFGLTSYPSIANIPEQVDLAIIVTPAATVPGIVEECVQAKVRSAIVISAGFKELGDSGLALELDILKHAKRGRMPIIGPNCLGVMNPLYGLNATFAKGMALPGNLAFISQSGAMCSAVLDWSLQAGVGFSSFVSIGSMADVAWGDLIDYLGGDPQTQSILIYMETIGDPRAFISAAREIALEKPIIVIKGGRSPAAAQAAASHTGSLAGSDEVFDCALERAGVLRVNSIADLFSMASLLGRQPRPKGPRLAIMTNAGGPAVLATDAVVLHGAELAKLEPHAVEELNAFLPPAWSHGNPVDILGDASPERYQKTLTALAKDDGNDGILVILSPQDMTDPAGVAEALRSFAHMKKPLLASWMGGSSVWKGIEILNQANIPTFEYPDDAARAFATMWRYSRELSSLYEMAERPKNVLEASHSHEQVRALLEGIRQTGRTLLDEFEAKQVLSLYGIPVVQTLVAKTVEEAVACAEQLRFPVVVKLYSQTITHKSDVGGVKLNIRSSRDVVHAFDEIRTSVERLAGNEHFQGVTVQQMVNRSEGYEIILGSSVDEQFGPVILFGTGGQLVEVYKDRALALPPLNGNLASLLMQKTKIYEALLGVRGRQGVDMPLLEQIVVRFSLLIAENPWIKECDINPLLVSSDQIIALDARIVMHGLDVPDERLPKLAIRPYPNEYVLSWHLKNGQPLTMRPIKPEDEGLMIAFHKELSEKSVRQRYFAFMTLDERVAHERLIRICFNDYDRDFTIVAEVQDSSTKAPHLIGVGRLSRLLGSEKAQFKLIITDAYHNLGLGTQLLKHLITIAQKEKIQSIEGKILSENSGMIAICQKLGFFCQPINGGEVTQVIKNI
jgi:acetyltransferase